MTVLICFITDSVPEMPEDVVFKSRVIIYKLANLGVVMFCQGLCELLSSSQIFACFQRYETSLENLKQELNKKNEELSRLKDSNADSSVHSAYRYSPKVEQDSRGETVRKLEAELSNAKRDLERKSKVGGNSFKFHISLVLFFKNPCHYCFQGSRASNC